MNDKYGKFHFKIESLLEEKSISKNKLCKDMDILRPNLNKYCRDEVQRFDSLFLSKLCHYFNCTPYGFISKSLCQSIKCRNSVFRHSCRS